MSQTPGEIVAKTESADKTVDGAPTLMKQEVGGVAVDGFTATKLPDGEHYLGSVWAGFITQQGVDNAIDSTKGFRLER